MVEAVWPPISRTDLALAADRDGFAALFPILIRRLIAETAVGLEELEMPGEGGTAVGGFDGVVATSGATSRVPSGRSVWELSVQQSPGVKADDDYGKRKSGPHDADPSDFTYVQVSLRVWAKGPDWATDRAAEGRWKSVRAINLDSIHQWLESAPGTTVWLANQLGKPLHGVRSVADWFERNWLPSTEPALSPALVLAGREASANKLRTTLRSSTPYISVAGDVTSQHASVGALSPDEFTAFVASTIATSDAAHREAWFSRALVVSARESLPQVWQQTSPLLLVVPDAAMAAEIPYGLPHQLIVLAPLGNDADVSIGRVDSDAAASAFTAAGLPRDAAQRLGVLARESLPAVRRAIAKRPANMHPEWATQPDAMSRRLLLLGAWNGSDQDDRALLAEHLGCNYSDAEDRAAVLAEATIPALGRFDGRWYSLSAEDTWKLIRPTITPEDLNILAAMIEQVLQEPDPFLGMEAQDRITEQLTGSRRRYSDTLRRSLAQSLALLAIAPPPNHNGATFSRRLVWMLLTNANDDRTYQRWGALADVLDLLAEAAPEEFLEAVRRGLDGDNPLHSRMFEEAGPNAMFGSTPIYPTFMHTLELLARPAEHFDETVDVLFRLDALDPGRGNWANRPDRSLADIFSTWAPETTADIEQRMRALRRFAGQRPARAFELVLNLIPDGTQNQVVHRGPRFRSWEAPARLTRTEFDNNVLQLSDLLLEMLGTDFSRYDATTRKIGFLPPSQRQKFLERLIEQAPAQNDLERAQEWQALHDVYANHRDHAEAPWAMSAEELEPLKSALNALKPESVVARNAWLFASEVVYLGDGPAATDFAVHRVEVAHRRTEAITEILNEGGIASIAELARTTEFPYIVGVALASSTSQDDHDRAILGWTASPSPERVAASAYFARRLSQEGATLLDNLLEATHSADQQVVVLLAAGANAETWHRVNAHPLDVNRAYWQRFQGLGSTPGEIRAIAAGFLGVGRYAAVLDLLSVHRGTFETAEAAEFAAVACERMIAADVADPELQRLSSYDFEHLFELMYRHRAELGGSRALDLEWQLYPVLRFDAQAPSLHRTMAAEAGLFVQLVTLLGDHSASSKQRNQAFQVLRSWRLCPGVLEDGTMDRDLLRGWVEEAVAGLRDAGVLELGIERLGGILAHAPSDPDGMAPPRAVRDLLEDINDDDLDSGLSVGLFNKRGVVSRSIGSGGDSERELAAAFQAAAAGAGPWPRTRRVLQRLAGSYESFARDHDIRDEQFRRGLS
ncbi:hypothetical protein [Glycomyces tritici]|uniref:XRE family transcriptional regulator n=1 Tax=Glycomyces tritici TaxID=2665176 RepID=A0ABT7YX13_9ACTN|nr:hypothetical protein [Glycomyces tritici]MDN3243185.1 hypothetical protein [Glycomyces tritici]